MRNMSRDNGPPDFEVTLDEIPNHQHALLDTVPYCLESVPEPFTLGPQEDEHADEGHDGDDDPGDRVGQESRCEGPGAAAAATKRGYQCGGRYRGPDPGSNTYRVR
jgi:hypothetical protein